MHLLIKKNMVVCLRLNRFLSWTEQQCQQSLSSLTPLCGGRSLSEWACGWCLHGYCDTGTPPEWNDILNNSLYTAADWSFSFYYIFIYCLLHSNQEVISDESGSEKWNCIFIYFLVVHTLKTPHYVTNQCLDRSTVRSSARHIWAPASSAELWRSIEDVNLILGPDPCLSDPHNATS